MDSEPNSVTSFLVDSGSSSIIDNATPTESSETTLLHENKFDPEDSTADPYCDIPDAAFIRIFQFLPLRSLKNCRSVNRRWYNLSLSHKILRASTCFAVDGRLMDQNGSRFQNYIERDSRHGLEPWSMFRIQKCSFDQVSWISRSITSTITRLELNNSSMAWFNILRLISEIEHLTSFSDVQDMYCWDYVTFSHGLESEVLAENTGYQTLNLEKLGPLRNLKEVEIHRSQITDCTLYMKMLLLWCDKLEFLSVTSDQSLSPRPTGAFYTSLGQLIQKNSNSLQKLWFPYKCIYPIYEVRVADDHFPFRDFLVFVTLNRWGEEIRPIVLTELAIQFPAIHIEEAFFKEKLLPFLSSWSTVRKLILNCIYMEPGREHLLVECIPRHITSPVLGLWWSDIATGQVPSINQIKDICQTITIQPFRLSLGSQLKEFLPLYDPEDLTQTSLDQNNCQYLSTTELQFFSKSPHFRFFNVDLITLTFKSLTHLNLVDHNSRIDRNHASDSACTLEDDDLQLIIANLHHLTFLQLIGNLVYLTDAGITGISAQACRRMLKWQTFVTTPGDVIGQPLHKLQSLRNIVLRGVGIKITDVSAYFGFCSMPYIRKVHIYGAQQITSTGRVFLQSNCWCARGCDVQV